MAVEFIWVDMGSGEDLKALQESVILPHLGGEGWSL